MALQKIAIFKGILSSIFADSISNAHKDSNQKLLFFTCKTPFHMI